MVEPKTFAQQPVAVLSTRDKIIAAAIHLFNQHGVTSVPMHKIAANLGISPGNLAYHFKSKRDVVAAIFPLIEARMREVLLPPGRRVSPRGAAEYQIMIFRSLWQYRFFFNGLVGLLDDDIELAKNYKRFQHWVINTLSDLIKGLVAHRDMRSMVPPNTTLLVANNMWMLWLSWLRFEQMVCPDRAMVEDAAIFDAALGHFSLMQPYYGRAFAERLLSELQSALGQSRPLPGMDSVDST